MRDIHDVWVAADGWQRWALIVLAISAVGQTGFFLVYSNRPWFSDEVGRALMLKSSSLMVILWLSLVNQFFIYKYQEAVTTIALTYVAVAIVWQFLTILRTPGRLDHYDEMRDENGDHQRSGTG
jgi:putative copper export protein